MRHRGGENNHLDSAGVPFPTRHRFRRGSLAALLSCLALVPALAGCAEDRSNLIPPDVSSSVISKINRAEDLAAEGRCFEAQEVAADAQTEIENLGGNFDRELKRSLVDGVVRLQGLLGDPQVCQDSSTVDPVETEEPPTETEGTTGETGTTDAEPNTTGEQGTTTDDEDDPENNQGNGNGNDPSANPPTKNPVTPTPPTTPTQPTNPPTGPGSGGLGPG